MKKHSIFLIGLYSFCRSVFSHFEKSVLSNLTAEEWMQIEEKAVTREVTECPICLRSLELSEATITGDR